MGATVSGDGEHDAFDAVPKPWAKLKRADPEGYRPGRDTPHDAPVTGVLSLIGHSADVAAVLRALLGVPTIGGRLARLLGKPRLEAIDLERLTALASLHDLGKVNVGFQRKPFRATGLRAGHVAPLVALVAKAWRGCDSAAQRILGEFCDRGRLGDAAPFLFEVPDADGEPAPFKAIMAHHGRLPDADHVEPRLWAASEGYDPCAATAALMAAIRGWCPLAFEPGTVAWTPAFGHAFAGLLTLADWLGSDETRFGFPADGAPDGPGRFPWALERARATVEHLALDPSPARTVATGLSWSSLALTGHHEARPAQAAMLTLAPPSPAGRLCLIEAETGSGKTEAALIHFLDLFRQGAVDGMYFALPTRAAAKQIHSRIEVALVKLLGADAPPVGLAVPGYVGDAETAPLPDDGTLWPDDGRRDASWATERPKRYLAGWVMVGTVDQVLMGGLRVRHAQLRSGAMLRLLLVVDEVHASDVNMTSILRNLLVQHRRAGGHALLMSATLGSAARLAFMHLERQPPQPLPLAVESEVAYPAVWTNERPEPLPAPEPTGPPREKSVRVELETRWPSPEAVLARAVAAASRGARVLVIRNTVRLAVATQQALEAEAAHLALGVNDGAGGLVRCPHHARFAPEDRRLLDDALEAAFGKNGERQGGLIAVTTQTAEQSLDVDADLLITDLCPADVLLQRIGRLHRHQRVRPPGFQAATVVVVAPPEAYLERAIGKNGEVRDAPVALGLVYPDLVGVLATRRALEAGPTLSIPKDNRRLVETATHPAYLKELAQALGGAWLEQWQAVGGRNYAHANAARDACIDWNVPIVPLPSDGNERIATRLGLDDRTFELPPDTIGPFGRPISRVTVPARWLGSAVAEDAVPTVSAGAGRLQLTIAEHRFVYDRFGLRQG